MRQVLYIGRVAQDPGLSVHAIRFHEREGLLRRLFATKGAFESSVTRRSVISSLFATPKRLASLSRRFLSCWFCGASQQACAHIRDLLGNVLKRVNDTVGDLLRYSAS
jgi:hypothetical protein